LCIVYQILGLSCIGYWVYRILGIRSLGIRALCIRCDLQGHRSIGWRIADPIKHRLKHFLGWLTKPAQSKSIDNTLLIHSFIQIYLHLR